MKRFSRRFVVVNGALVVVIGLLAYFAIETIFPSTSSAASGRTVSVTTGTVTSSVSASGNVSPVDTYDLASSGSGKITSLKVTTGSKVTKGEVLAVVDPSTVAQALQTAQIQLQSAQETLTDAENYGGDTAVQRAADNYSLQELRQTVTNDQTTLNTAQAQLTTDEGLCYESTTTTIAPVTTTTSTTTTSTTTPTRTTTSTPASGSKTSTTVSKIPVSIPSGGRTVASSTFEAAATSTGTTTALSSASTSSAGSGGSSSTGCSAETSDQNAITQANNALVQAENQVTSTNLSNTAKYYISPSQLAMDKLTVTEDQQTVTSDQQAAAGTTVVAPVAGTVTAVDEAVGDTVTGSVSTSSGSSGTSSTSSGTTSSGSTAASGSSATGTGTTGTGTTGTGTGTTGSASTGTGTSASSGTSSTTASSGTATSSSGTTILEVANLTQLEVVAGFAEADASKIAVGQPATVTLDALTNTSVTGKVTAISASSTTVSNVVEYDETIGLTNPPSTVQSGMTATVAVTTQSAANVLELPTAAITTTGTTSTVNLVKAGKKSTQTVTVGLVGDTTTQIKSGLALGATVLEPTATVSAGSSSSTGSSSGLSGTLGGGTGVSGGGFGGGATGFGGGTGRTGRGG